MHRCRQKILPFYQPRLLDARRDVEAVCPLGNCHREGKDIATRDTRIDFRHRRGMVEAVLAGLQHTPLPEANGVKTIAAADNAGLFQRNSDLCAGTSGSDLYERLAGWPGRQKDEPCRSACT